MLGATLLRLVTVVTPDDVRWMKAAGLGDLAKGILNGLGMMVTGWRRECGHIDSEIWAEMQIRLNELRAVLGDSGSIAGVNKGVCKERFDKKEGRDERGKGDKGSIKEAKGRALEKDATAGQLLSPWAGNYGWYSGMGFG